MKAGDRVHWNGANRVESGVLTDQYSAPHWLVALDNGKYVIVNENSFIQ